MDPIITSSTVSTVTTFALAASFGLMVAIALIIFLVQKEIAMSISDSRAKVFGRFLNIAIVPLFLVFIFLVVVKLVEALR